MSLFKENVSAGRGRRSARMIISMLCIVVSANAHAQMVVTDLGLDQATAINDSGQVVGNRLPGSSTIEPYVWTPVSPNATAGTSQKLPIIPGEYLSEVTPAVAINNSGKIAGDGYVALTWTNGSPSKLGIISPDPYDYGTEVGWGRAINDAGEVVGWGAAGNGFSYPILWSPAGTPLILGDPPGGAQSLAHGLNNNHQVVGRSFVDDLAFHAIVWTLGGLFKEDLGSAPDIDSEAYAVSDHGIVVGWESRVPGSFKPAFAALWTPHIGGWTKTDLGTLLGGRFSFASAINEAGVVVGHSEVFDGVNLLGKPVFADHAFIWRDGVMRDLNRLLPPKSGWILEHAVDINEHGQIVGDGRLEGSSYSRGFLLSPDISPPTTTLSSTGPLGSNDWHVGPVQVTLSATDPDGAADVAATYYKLNGGATQTYTAPFTLEAEDVYAISYWSVDRANNTEAARAATIMIDSIAPLTSAATSGPSGNNGWFRGDVVLSLTANDETSGVDVTYYTVDGGPMQTYTGAATITGDGVHSVDYWSVDVAGNEEAKHHDVISIDATAPLVTAVPDRDPDQNGWYNHMMTVTWNGTDELSGIDFCDPPAVYSGPEVAAGLLSGSCTDKAGNTSSARFSFRYDSTPPTCTAVAEPATLWPANHRLKRVTVEVSVSDALSAAAGFILASASSNESDNGPADGDTSRDIRAFDVGAPDVGGWLRAERAGTGSDRGYTLAYRASDMAGNETTCAARVTVPHDRRR